MKFIGLILFLLIFCPRWLDAKNYCPCLSVNEVDSCETIKDTLTQKTVYISADVLPENEGGQEYRMKKFRQITTDSIPPKYDGNYVVAFIVDTAGNIYGERFVKGPIARVGFEIINIIKSLKWKAAICNGKKVNMLYTIEINFDPSEN